MLLGGRGVHSADDKIDVSSVQFPGQRSQIPDDDMKGHPRILSRQPMNDRRIDCGYGVLAPSHAYLAYCRIGERRDVLHALPQFVEHGDASLDERAAIGCRLYALPAPVEQAHAEGVLQIGDRLGNGGLRHVEGTRRLAHAAGLNDGHENIDVAQSEAAADAVVPLRGGGHS